MGAAERDVRGLAKLNAFAHMDVPLLIGAGILFLLGLSLVRYPKRAPPTQRQDDDALFGKGVELQDYVARFYNGTLIRSGGVPRTSEMRALGFISLIASIVLVAKAFGAI